MSGTGVEYMDADIIMQSVVRHWCGMWISDKLTYQYSTWSD